MTGPADQNGSPDEFEGILTDLDRLARGVETVTFGQIFDTIGARGYGPILVIVSLFLILPVGMVPGVPLTVSIVLGLVGFELIFGGRILRLPRRARAFRVESDTLRGITRRMRPYARRLSLVLRPRLRMLAASRLALIAVALVLFGTATVILVIGFIPGLPFLISLHVLLLGLGLTARDGLAVGLGFLALLPSALVVLRFVL